MGVEIAKTPIHLTVQSHGNNLWRLYIGVELSKCLRLNRGDWFEVEVCGLNILIHTTCGIDINNPKPTQKKKGYDLYNRKISNCIHEIKKNGHHPLKFEYLGTKNDNEKGIIHRINYIGQ